MLTGGVDPGGEGAIVFLRGDGTPALVWAADAKRADPLGYYLDGEPDVLRLIAGLVPLRDEGVIKVVIEEPMCPRASGTATALKIGRSWGALLSALKVARLPVQRVTPAKWSTDIFRGKKGNSDREKKDAGVRLCMERLPAVSLILPGCRVAHSGIADAALIALWAQGSSR